ncbi:hypothetical protein D1646_17210 [Pseudoflavonifractor sp. 60]|uniref:DUF6892 domain-containing protein n=1 Tax=Pseudoflavonifractor sp. 60 TaxID=2304576 RepID=UPI00136E83B4|nr:hypothetical protein [Pseudoflavonifractor sp. 60]NBI68494.1 hypothetical protein [Pseudoflavonifractor sp. 60]
MGRDHFAEDPAAEYLVFDNLPFKLAAAQKLMYEQKLLGEKYRGGDEYFQRYSDVEEVSEEESIARLKPYIERGNQFFQGLKIPAALASTITELYVGEEMEIYFQINPQWLDFDEIFEADFDITAVSEREVKQFPNLKSVTFNMYHTPPEKLVKQLRGLGLEVTVAD